MARCGNCGKANRDGALFCQDCGKSLEPQALSTARPNEGRAAQPAVVGAALGGGHASSGPGAGEGGGAQGLGLQGPGGPGPSVRPSSTSAPGSAARAAGRNGDGVPCVSCGSLNSATVNFCRSCGTPLGGGGIKRPPEVTSSPVPPSVSRAAQSSGSPQSAISRVSCANCGEHTPAGFAFCQHCGHRLQQGDLARAGSAESGASMRGRLPSTDLPPPGTALAAAASGPAAPVAPGAAAAPGASGDQRPAVGKPAPRPTGAARAVGERSFGRLIALRRDGSDGDSIQLTGDTFDIGRSEGTKIFSDDPFMAPRHARFSLHAGGVRVRALDLVNGVFVQVHEPHELHSGDVFYIGRELLRFELLQPEERDPAPSVEHGVRVFGSAPRESWGRLRQLTTAATVRDLWHLSRSEILLGREEGDIVFPDDEFMSRRHALLTRSGQRVRLEDQHSSNGTYVRLRGERELQPSDVLRVGDQVLRFEPQ